MEIHAKQLHFHTPPRHTYKAHLKTAPFKIAPEVILRYEALAKSV
jgi:hypothetical protein